MRSMLKKAATLIAITLVSAVLMLAFMAPSAWAALTVKANHDDVRIGYNYHGSNVTVSGVSDPGVDLVLKIASANANEKMMRKDKVAGLLWMNVEEVHLDNVPEVYFLRSTRDPGQLLDAAQRQGLDIGYDAVAQNADISPLPDPGKKNALFNDFVRYQESRSRFSQTVGGIDVSPEAEAQSYFTSFDWPFQVSPGEYQVTAYAIRDGSVVDTARTMVTVENVGEVKALSDMATDNGALYGAAAILVAIAAGFSVGIVFRSGGGAH